MMVMQSLSKVVVGVLLGFGAAQCLAEAHDAHCTESIVLEVYPGDLAPGYAFRGVRYAAYPLDVLSSVLRSCPHTKEIDFVLDPKTPMRNVLVAYGATQKSQFETIRFFAPGASRFFPFSLGDGTAKPVAK